MGIPLSVLWIIFAGFAVSYGWGIRGCIIGGERGALLPGAIIGTLFAYMTGDAYFIENFWLFAAAGALTMFYGGSEPYGETLGFVLKRTEDGQFLSTRKKGLAGTFLKGALWFAICGAGLGMMFGALSAKYRWYDIVIVFGSLPFMQELGVLIFNKPYDKFKKRYPKIYFSLTRREEWGGNVIMLLEMTVLALVRRDYFTALLSLFGFVFGGFGFMGGLLIYDKTSHPLKNGKYLFGKAQTGGFIDGWKIMEHFFGAVGGAGLALCLCIFFGYTKAAGEYVAIHGAWNVLGVYGNTAAGVMLGAFLLLLLQYIFVPKAEKKLSEEKIFRLGHLVELIERPFFAAFPFALVLLGSLEMAKLSSGLIIVYVLLEKCLFSGAKNFKHGKLLSLFQFAVFLLFIVGELCFDGYNAFIFMLMYTAVYTLSAFALDFHTERYLEAKKNHRLKNYFGNTVIIHFIIQTVVILIVCAYIM